MPDDPKPFDFGFPAAPGDYWPAIMGDPGGEIEPVVDPTGGAGDRLWLTRGSAQSISDSTYTNISWTGNLIDTGGYWDPGDPEHISLTPGLYLVSARLTYAANAVGWRYLSLEENGIGGYRVRTPPVSGGGTTELALTCFWGGTGTHYLQTYQNSGGALDVTAALYMYRLTTVAPS